MSKRYEYRGVGYEIGATIDGNGAWVGEFITFKKSSDGSSVKDSPYIQAPGEFASESKARLAADADAKRFIDELILKNQSAQ
ncbi:hypothetical protein [Noviherbaspirillum saxi]|uniref:Uncharacterized protein n=1 Tax=Noviherbaspirillum saxi TaxID=2320863 RepID=A0A3A3FQS4_9BURK|nr:hypothetical protein [Noviherbaspirillum saxi]RJF95812.1 hypothetical protein D3871_20785 [Noviherbaspirillum saxi]